MTDNSSLTFRNRLLRWAGTIVALVLLAYVLSRQGWGEFFIAVRSIPVSTFALVLTLTLASRFAVAGRWASLLLSSGIQIRVTLILKITFAGMFASNFLPTSVGGDIVRLAGTMAIKEKKNIYASSIVMDRLIGALGMGLLLPVGITSLVLGPGLPALQQWFGASPFVGGAIGTTGRSSVDKRVRSFVRLAWETVRSWAQMPKALGLALCFTWAHMLLKFTSMWFLFRSLGESIGFLTMGGLWSIVYFITLFPISVNGIGIQEVSAGIVFSNLAGAADTSGLAVAILIRTAEMIASLPGAIALPQFLAAPRRAPSETANDA